MTTLEPSRGGIGMRLNTPKITLTTISVLKIKAKAGAKGTIRGQMSLRATASKRFANGPLRPIQTISVLGFFKARKFIGTGLAAPKMNRPPLAKKISKGKITVPKGSI